MLGFFNLLWTKGPSVAPLLHIIQSIPSLPNHVVYRLYLSDPTLLACKHFSSSTCVIIPISGRSFRLTLTPLSAAGGSFFSFLIYITSYVACIWGSYLLAFLKDDANSMINSILVRFTTLWMWTFNQLPKKPFTLFGLCDSAYVEVVMKLLC